MQGLLGTTLKNQQQNVAETYANWAETWGLSLAFGVTQSLEKSEKIISDCIVAIIATDMAKENAADLVTPFVDFSQTSVDSLTQPFPSFKPSPVRLASAIWQAADAHAYRGFGPDIFFKLPALTRAVVLLKTKARFSRVQIATALNLSFQKIDDHLENARLLFSSGKPWIGSSPEIEVTDLTWNVKCATAANPKLADFFDRYLGNDLDAQSNQKLQAHLVHCPSCRNCFFHFKKEYANWVSSIPTLEPHPKTKRLWIGVTHMAFKTARNAQGAQPRKPRAWPGIKRVVQDHEVRLLLTSALSLFVFQLLLRKFTN